MVNIVGGQARNIAQARDRLQEIAHLLIEVGLDKVGVEIHNIANTIWANADALYIEILKLRAEKNNEKVRRRRRRRNHIPKG